MIIDNVKILLGLTGNDKDELLEILLAQAEEDALMITKRDRLFGMNGVLERMVVYLYNRLGTEGLNSESYSGASYNYTDGYPDDIMDMLQRYAVGVNAGGKLITY